MQVEYATDLVFHKQDVLRTLYEALSARVIRPGLLLGCGLNVVALEEGVFGIS